MSWFEINDYESSYRCPSGPDVTQLTLLNWKPGCSTIAASPGARDEIVLLPSSNVRFGQRPVEIAVKSGIQS